MTLKTYDDGEEEEDFFQSEGPYLGILFFSVLCKPEPFPMNDEIP